MWTPNRKRVETVEPCRHVEVTATATAGLRRTVCGDCGHVSVGYLFNVFEEQSRQLVEEAEAETD